MEENFVGSIRVSLSRPTQAGGLSPFLPIKRSTTGAIIGPSANKTKPSRRGARAMHLSIASRRAHALGRGLCPAVLPAINAHPVATTPPGFRATARRWLDAHLRLGAFVDLLLETALASSNALLTRFP
jgi:hypothetical protein